MCMVYCVRFSVYNSLSGWIFYYGIQTKKILRMGNNDIRSISYIFRLGGVCYLSRLFGRHFVLHVHQTGRAEYQLLIVAN